MPFEDDQCSEHRDIKPLVLRIVTLDWCWQGMATSLAALKTASHLQGSYLAGG